MGANSAHKGQPTKREICLDFAENTTVHGVKNAFVPHSRPRRILWIIAFTAAVGGLMYTLVAQVIEMAALPTITQQTLEIRPSLPFPAVTLCNLNQIPKSLIENNEAARHMFVSTSSLLTASQLGDMPPVNLSMFKDKVDEIFTGPIWPTLQRCSWKNREYDCEEIFTAQKTDLGFCYTFNGKNGPGLKGILTDQPGSSQGLTVTINIQQDEFLPFNENQAAGMRVLLHDHKETPLVDGRGFDVSPGTATKGSLSITKVTNLPPPYKTLSGSQCVDTSIKTFTNKLELFDTYDPKACIYECRYKYIYTVCKCRALFDPGNATICDTHELFGCYEPRYDEFKNKNLELNCDCPVPCEWNVYKAQMSMAAYPSIAMMPDVKAALNVSISNEEFRQDYLKLTLAYDNLHLESVTQVPKYTLASIVSSLGGQMGMFLGVSVLSVLEVFDFLLQLIVRTFRSPKQRKITSTL